MEKLKKERVKGAQVIKPPDLCKESELRGFYQLVRQGGQVKHAGLPQLIREARLLAFYYVDSTLASVAGLKTPRERYKNRIFREAGLEPLSGQFHTELGWAVTRKEFQGSGLATKLTQKLLRQIKKEKIFATTASNNSHMQRILARFGFTQAGHPFGGQLSESSPRLLWLLEKQ